MRPSRTSLGVAAVGGAAAGFILIGIARMDDLKKWFLSQWGLPSGPTGWPFAVAMPAVMRELYGAAAESARFRDEDDVLDVACGAGVFLADYAKHARKVAGLDASAMQLRLARRRLRHRLEAGTAEVSEGNAASLPWEDGSFTVVTCLLGLEFFSDPHVALREMMRVLRPGGRLVATFGIDESDEACVKECDWLGYEHLPEAEVRKMVEDAGFAALHITYPALEYHARLVEGIKPA